MMDYAGIDYYTATTNLERIGMQWFNSWEKHRESALKTGCKVVAMRRYGYDCLFIQGLTWGKHERNGYMMQSSGHVASLTWQKVLPSARRITRVDLQYTFQSPEELDLREQFESWEKADESNRKGTVIHNSLGGQTIYIGSRTSNQFGRFYNKSVESSLETENVYRLEVELKKPRADTVIESLYDSFQRCDIRASAVRDYVLSWFEERGVTTGINFDRMKPIQLSKVATSDEKRLTWLKTAVAPTLADLLQRQKGKDVAKALGLNAEDYQQLAIFAKKGEAEREETKRRIEAFSKALDNKAS